MSLYRRDPERNERTCKFCGMKGLHWSEVAPNKHRLHEANGAIHDCRQFHENKNAPDASRGSLLKRMNVWTQRWYKVLPQDAAEELDLILDDAAQSR